MDRGSSIAAEPFSPTSNPEPISGSSRASRRKVRKGTRSCWECRRRKIKCVFASSVNSTCNGCRQRGATCVDQRFPEQVSAPLDRSIQLTDRIVRVEALVDNLTKLIPTDRDPEWQDRAACENGIPRCGSLGRDFAWSPVRTEPLSSRGTDSEAQTDQYHILASDNREGIRCLSLNQQTPPEFRDFLKLSQALHRSLPTPKDIDIIANARGGLSTYFFQILTTSYRDLTRNSSQSLDHLFTQPAPTAHPVLIGLYMLRVATFLQNLHPDLHRNLKGLSEHPRQMMRRLFNTAVDLVTTNDDLVRSIEGLQCVMMESLWHTNSGHLHKGLLAIRKAMTIAQSMGLHRSSSSTRFTLLRNGEEPDTKTIWFRIVFAERHICLMLGLPPSSIDHSTASNVIPESDSPMGRLERHHSVITSRILQRNQSDPSPSGFSITQELDRDLQKAAAEMPLSWWLHSSLATALADPETLFWDMRQLFHQLFHYHLVIQLHLPYMLQQSSSRYDGSQYSKATCVNASREVLSRFRTFHQPDRAAFWCRTMDYLAFTAALTLLMVYIDSHCPKDVPRSVGEPEQHHSGAAESQLTHQRFGDLAMIGEVQKMMKEVCQRNKDVLGERSAMLLQKLVVIEGEAAGKVNEVEGASIQVCIPYHGTVEVSPKGITSKLAGQQHSADTFSHSYGQIPGACLTDRLSDVGRSPRVAQAGAKIGGGTSTADMTEENRLSYQDVDLQESTTQCQDVLSVTGCHDWADQSIDMAFFTSLLDEAEGVHNGTIFAS